MNLLKLLGVAALVLASWGARPEVLRGAVKASVTQAGAETTLEGNLEVIVEDSGRGSRTLYFLIFGDRRVTLRFTSKPPPNLTTGTRVRVRGQWETDDTLVVTTIEML